MADSSKQFNATNRVPSRPLSYEYRDLAQPKELLVDYNRGIIYVVTATKEFINITDAIKDQISMDADSVRDVEIDLPDGSKVTIEAGIVQALTELDTLQDTVSELANSISNLKAYNETGVLILDATISADADDWSDTDGDAPYKQTITLEGILETDYPIVDINLSDDYGTAVDELESYGRIMKILTFDGYIEVYATEPTSVALNVFMKTDRKLMN